MNKYRDGLAARFGLRKEQFCATIVNCFTCVNAIIGFDKKLNFSL